jgi:predicted HAD superfamily Cof-like phosphohydrolase
MSNPFDDVKAFMNRFKLTDHCHPTGQPALLNDDLFRFRMEFLREEMLEYLQSHEEGDLVGCCDALMDLIYVAIGTAHFHGFLAKSAWNAVHSANMKKIPVSSPGESKRNSSYDIVKPEGWVGPEEYIRRIHQL